MLFKNITILDENFEVQKHMNVGVKGEIIAYIGREEPKEDFGEVYDGNNRLLIPGFYNEHSHLPMMLMRGYGENLTLMNWLNTRIFPFEAHLTGEDMYWGAMSGIAEMLRYGICSTQEMYLDYNALGRAFRNSGIKGCFSKCVTWFSAESYRELEIYKETLEALKEFNDPKNDRFRAEISLHAEYTSTEKVAKGVAEFAAENGLSMHVHVSETRSEVDICRARHQRRSPVRYLHDCGIFEVPTVAAHCVHIDDEDIEILREDKVTVATCPKSNAKLGSGICPVSSILEKGINVAVGTDSVASNNNLNMLEELRFLSLLQKVDLKNPEVISPKELMYIATRAGALAQQRENSGLVKEGFKADLTVFDIDRVYMKPEYDVLNNLVYSASGTDVVLTMVDGKVLYRDGEYTTLDIERINYETEKSRQRILGAVAASQVPDLEEK